MFENMTKAASDSVLALMKEYSKMMEKGIDPQGFAEAMKTMVPNQTMAPNEMLNKIPKMTFNKNGYEIRTKVLEMAQGNVWNDYHAKFAGWEQTVKRDTDTGEVVMNVNMPEVPGAEEVLDAAEKFYAFVNGK